MPGSVNKRIVFLCSGGGGNLSFVHHAIRGGGLLGAEIVGVITDRHCAANQFCEQVGLDNRVIAFDDQGQGGLLAALQSLEPDVVITTVHKIIDRAVVQRYEGKLINLHYSLLPAFAGLIGAGPVKAALAQRVRFGGVTVHWVNEEVDAGVPVVQGVIALQRDEVLEQLMPVVFRSGCIALLRALVEVLGDVPVSASSACLEIAGRTCVFNGGGALAQGLIDNEAFWNSVQASVSAERPGAMGKLQ